MGILQVRILEWTAMPSSRGSSQPKDQTQVSHIVGRFFTIWATQHSVYLYFKLRVSKPTHLLPRPSSLAREFSRLSYVFVWFPPYFWSHRLKTLEIFLTVSSQICSHLPFLLCFLLSFLCMLLPGQACSVRDWPWHPLPRFPNFPMFLQTCLEWSSSSYLAFDSSHSCL